MTLSIAFAPRNVALFSIFVVAMTLGACSNPRDQRMLDGALIGGTGGAIIGGVATGTGGGAVVGGVAGAAVGAAVADATRPRHSHKICYWSDTLDRRVCRYR